MRFPTTEFRGQRRLLVAIHGIDPNGKQLLAQRHEMVLDQNDCQLLELGQPVRCVESTSHLSCVVLRADVFDRIGWLFDKTADEAIQDMHKVLAETSPEDWKAVEEWKAS